MKSIKNMNSREFELFIAYLFQLKGYKIEVTPTTVDMGRDIIVSTDNGDIFIECKHYSDNVFVGRPVVQKLLGSMTMFKATKGIIINTGQYHKNAIEASNMVSNLELWNIDDIIEMIKQIDSTEILRYLDYDRELWEAKEIKN